VNHQIGFVNYKDFFFLQQMRPLLQASIDRKEVTRTRFTETLIWVESGPSI